MRPRPAQAHGARPWATRALFLLVPFLAGCWTSGNTGRPPDGSGGADGAPGISGRNDRLVVYAAASLTQAFSALAERYESRQPGVRVVLSLDSSAALRARIEQGAPADVLAAADVENPRRLVEAGLAAGEAVVFARNRLAIVVPSDNPAGIERAADLARAGVRLVAAGEEVPITRYVGQLLERLAGESGAPADFVGRVHENVVSREDNVRAVLAKVELGEADAGIVYATDARSSRRVRTIPVPESANVSVTYAAVAVRSSADPARGIDFVRWLAGPEAREVLVDSGFVAASGAGRVGRAGRAGLPTPRPVRPD